MSPFESPGENAGNASMPSLDALAQAGVEIPAGGFFELPDRSGAKLQSAISDPRLIGAIESLPARWVRILDLRFVSDLSHAEIAVEVGTSEGTVRWTVSAAVRRLRSILEAPSSRDEQTDFLKNSAPPNIPRASETLRDESSRCRRGGHR